MILTMEKVLVGLKSGPQVKLSTTELYGLLLIGHGFKRTKKDKNTFTEITLTLKLSKVLPIATPISISITLGYKSAELKLLKLQQWVSLLGTPHVYSPTPFF